MGGVWRPMRESKGGPRGETRRWRPSSGLAGGGGQPVPPRRGRLAGRLPAEWWCPSWRGLRDSPGSRRILREVGPSGRRGGSRFSPVFQREIVVSGPVGPTYPLCRGGCRGAGTRSYPQASFDAGWWSTLYKYRTNQQFFDRSAQVCTNPIFQVVSVRGSRGADSSD